MSKLIWHQNTRCTPNFLWNDRYAIDEATADLELNIDRTQPSISLLIYPMDRTIFAIVRDRGEFEVRRTRNSPLVLIENLRANSLAYWAGIRSGHHLITVNGVLTARLRINEIRDMLENTPFVIAASPPPANPILMQPLAAAIGPPQQQQQIHLPPRVVHPPIDEAIGRDLIARVAQVNDEALGLRFRRGYRRLCSLEEVTGRIPLQYDTVRLYTYLTQLARSHITMTTPRSPSSTRASRNTTTSSSRCRTETR